MLTHANRRTFSGVLTRLDEPSDKSPSGARGHKILITRDAAQQALPTLCGMALNCRPELTGHDECRTVGLITDAVIVSRDLIVKGYVWNKNYPQVVMQLLGRDDLGMSYELVDAHVEDMKATIWTLNRVTFTGAAVLLRQKAAYRKTSFNLRDDSGAVPIHLAASTGTLLDLRGVSEYN